MAKKRRGCLTEFCTEGSAEWKENTEGEREYIERGACEGALGPGTGLAKGWRGDGIRESLLKDAIECEREVGPHVRTTPGVMGGTGGTRGISGVGGTLSCRSVTNR